MATKAEVEFWKDMCRKLTGIMDRQDEIYTEVMSRLNARSEELKSLQAIVDGLEWQVEDLQEENDKLRELAADMWEGYGDPRCEECHLKDTPTCADCPICAREASVIDRMRELGMEVDV